MAALAAQPIQTDVGGDAQQQRGRRRVVQPIVPLQDLDLPVPVAEVEAALAVVLDREALFQGASGE